MQNCYRERCVELVRLFINRHQRPGQSRTCNSSQCIVTYKRILRTMYDPKFVSLQISSLYSVSYTGNGSQLLSQANLRGDEGISAEQNMLAR